MTRRAFSAPVASSTERGFTLLELCIVLLLIAVLMGVMMPSLQSAFVESALRSDERQLSLMVRTAMLRSSDEHQDYIVDLSAQSLTLRPAGGNPDTSYPDEVSALGSSDRLLAPDPKKIDAWIDMPATSWIFRPGSLCPATRVRLARGTSWLEINFNALTGDVENESAYFP